MRVAIGGIMHESNTFSSQLTTLRHFEEGSLTEGADLRRVWQGAHHEVGGFLEGADRFGFEAVPTVMAWATPAGPVEDAAFDRIVDRIVEGCRQNRVDALLLALHGAMVTPERPDADGDVLHQLRNVLGPKVPIISTLDFHANVSMQMVESADALIGYQTYPHVDQRQCGLAAAAMISRRLRGETRPAMALVKPPLIINLLGQETDREPMLSLMGRARRMEQEPGMLSVSVMAGFPYADVHEMGPAIVAVSDGDRSRAEGVAEDLERHMWTCRGALFVPCLGPAEAVARALARERRPVVLVDLGDNVGGGSAGDGTVLLDELIRRDVQGAVIVLYDPAAAAEACRVGLGGAFEGSVGGKTDHWHGEPVLLRGTVGCLHGGTWVEDEPRHGGRRHNDQGPTAVIETRDGTLVVLNSLRTPPFSLGQLTSLGIDPASRSILVVKAAVAYKAAYVPIAAEVIEVDTPGLTAIDAARLTYQHRRRPLFPLDPMGETMTTEGDL